MLKCDCGTSHRKREQILCGWRGKKDGSFTDVPTRSPPRRTPHTTKRANTSYLRDALIPGGSCVLTPQACLCRCCRGLVPDQETSHTATTAGSSAVVSAAQKTRRNTQCAMWCRWRAQSSEPMLSETSARWKLPQHRADARGEVTP